MCSSPYSVTKRERKWIRLSTENAESLREYSKLIEHRTRTTADVFNRYRTEVLTGKAESTRRKEAQYLARLEASFGDAPPGAIRPVHIYRYLDQRPKVTGNRELSVLSEVLAYAIRWGVIEDNPCKNAKRNAALCRARRDKISVSRSPGEEAERS